MCIATPLQAKEVLQGAAICDLSGVATHIDTLLIGAVEPGDWLLVHAGIAIQKLSEGDARLIADALEAAGRAQQGESFEHLFADLIGREPQLPPHLQLADQEPRDVAP